MAKQKVTNEVAKGPTGKRYSPEEKAKVIEYFNAHKEERGNTTATLEKFGISYIALRNWLGNNPKKGVKIVSKVGRPKKVRDVEVVHFGAKRGPKANPGTGYFKILSKMKTRLEKDLAMVNKFMEGIQK